MIGWISSAGSGRVTSMLLNATSTAGNHQPQRKAKQIEGAAAQTANLTKEKSNENQTDQRIRRRPRQGPALLYRRPRLCQEGRFPSGPVSLADRRLARRAGRHAVAAGAQQQPRRQSLSASHLSTGP